MNSFLFYLYQYTALSSRAVDGHHINVFWRFGST